MKVAVRQIGEDGIEQVFQLDNPFDIQIEIGIQAQMQRFQISHDKDTSLLRIDTDESLVVFPCTPNSIFLVEIK